MERKTSLYQTHLDDGGKMVSFAGYLLPVQYRKGIINEHNAVRTSCGIFDVSHMGEITCTGKDALRNLNMLLTNDFTGMADGQARYSPMCNENGGIVDDLIVYKKREDFYFIVVNASNKDKDYQWMKEHQFGDAVFTDISDSIAQIALQGPKSTEILQKLTEKRYIPEKYYTANFDGIIGGIECILSQTGYTGEKGYEIYMESDAAPQMWRILMEAGKEFGLIPCGLGARDTLRLEAAMPLYGHEMTDRIEPLECCLDFAVKMDKADFIGKSAMKTKDQLTRERVGLKVTGKGIARGGETIEIDGKDIGFVTSGTYGPYLEYAVAMGFIEIGFSEVGTRVDILIRGKKVEAEVVKLPFYQRTVHT